MQSARQASKINRVCIIGGGPAGIAAAKHLKAGKCFETIDIYDQRSDTGGVWCYEPENDHLNRCPVPHTDPEVPLEQPRWLGRTPSRATYQSPMYARLEANLPKMLMQHSDLDFPERTQLFPPRAEILDYLDRYADDVKSMIKQEQQVTWIQKAHCPESSWSVTTRNLRHGQQRESVYDALVVSSGHYTVPFIPSYIGIDQFNTEHPNVISHSKWFDDPHDYHNKKVLVIGLGPSGSDIATQISGYCAKPLLVSTRSQPPMMPPNSMHLPGIQEFRSEKQSICFLDGTVIDDLDKIIFCTGFLYSYPFLPQDIRQTLIYPPTDRPKAFYPGERCRNVYQHLFYTPDPTLAFLTLPWNIVPFPVAEGQGAIVARFLSGRLTLPSQSEMIRWEEERESEAGSGKSFHKLAPPADVDYINYLFEWSKRAHSGVDGHSNTLPLDDKTSLVFGKEPPFWGPWHRWMRINVPKFKKAFAEKGEERHSIKTLEDLGFHYDGKSP